MSDATLALSLRAGRIEGVHRGALAITDPSGSVLFSINDPNYLCYPRSAIKMVQAIPVVESGAADRYGFTDAELAICCASHSGAGYHLSAVSSILGKIGLTESALGCGAHEPDDRTERERLVVTDSPPSQLHNNCSGKHAGMLAACLAMGWTIHDY